MSPPSPSWEVSADDAPRWHWGRPGALRCGLELPAHGYMDTTITKTMYVVPCVCIYIYIIYMVHGYHIYIHIKYYHNACIYIYIFDGNILIMPIS